MGMIREAANIPEWKKQPKRTSLQWVQKLLNTSEHGICFLNFEQTLVDKLNVKI